MSKEIDPDKAVTDLCEYLDRKYGPRVCSQAQFAEILESCIEALRDRLQCVKDEIEALEEDKT